MEKNDEFELIIQPGRRPWWHTLIATVAFAFMAYACYDLYLECRYSDVLEHPRSIPNHIQGIATFFALGVLASVVKTVLIDTDRELLISRYHVGLISYDRKTTLPELEYVSLFCPDDPNKFEARLWYKGNRHYRMYAFSDKKEALAFASQVAQKLNIDLLDATEKGNSTWLDPLTLAPES